LGLEGTSRWLRTRGWHGSLLYTMKGRCGVDHVFDYAALKNSAPMIDSGMRSDVVAVEILVSQDDRSQRDRVLCFFAKTFDAGIRRKIVLAFPRLLESARKFAESYDMLALDCPDTGLAGEFLTKAFEPMLEKLKKRESSPPEPGATKRTSLDVMADILSVATTPCNKTEILYRSNLSFKQAQRYIPTLENIGLLKRYFEDGLRLRYVITERGREFLTNVFGHFGRIAQGGNSVWLSRNSNRTRS
jgi:predicted transcriptional regulator